MTSSNCFKRKKQLAMHCLPGMVSHSVAEAPTSWKSCCAVLRCSFESFFWPYIKYETALIIYYLGLVGSRSLTKLKAYSTESFFRLYMTIFNLVYGKSSNKGGKNCIAFYPFRKTTKLWRNKSFYLNRSPPLNFC